MALVDKNGNAVKSGNGNAIGSGTSSGNNNNNNSSSGDGRAANRARSAANLVAAKAAAARNNAGASGPPGRDYGVVAPIVAKVAAPLAKEFASEDQIRGAYESYSSSRDNKSPVNSISSKVGSAVSSLSEYLNNTSIVKGLEATLGEWFGGHEGQTYWDSKAPSPNSASYAGYVEENPKGKFDQFTYQMTPAEKNSQLDHAFLDGNPTTDRQRAIAEATGGRAPTSGGQIFYNADGTLNKTATAHAVNSQQRSNGNGGAGGGIATATGPLVNNINSPSSRYRPVTQEVPINQHPDFTAALMGLSNTGDSVGFNRSSELISTPISYGNSYNASRRWK